MRLTNDAHGRGRTALRRCVGAAVAGIMAAMMMTGPMASAQAAPADAAPAGTVADTGGNKHFMVYYRAWRDVTMKGVNTSLPDDNWMSMYDIPYGIDVVNVFSYVPPGQEDLAQPFYDKLKAEYAPYLHSRGIRLVRGIGYDSVTNGFRRYVAERGGSVQDATDADYEAFADHLVATYMTEVGLDGLDIDMETYPSAADIAISDRVITALSTRIGPKSGDPEHTMLLYDTNGSEMGPFKDVADCFDYVAYQQYGSDSSRTADAAADYEQYIPSSRFVPGLAFPEEQDHNRWFDAAEPYESSNIHDVASYSFDHRLGGMFLYALDRDGRTYDQDDLNHIKPSNLLWTKTAIAQSSGVTLEQSKEAANHFLDRMERTKAVPGEVRQAVAAATNLYEANKAVLGKDWDQGYSNTYDPALELQLKGIDIAGLQSSIDRADALIADAHTPADARMILRMARDAAVAGLADRLYTEDQVAQWSDTLAKAIAVVPVDQPTPDPSDNPGAVDPAPTPDPKPEPKPEVKPEVKPETKPVPTGNSAASGLSDGSVSGTTVAANAGKVAARLSETGASIAAAAAACAVLLFAAIGVVALRRR